MNSMAGEAMRFFFGSLGDYRPAGVGANDGATVVVVAHGLQELAHGLGQHSVTTGQSLTTHGSVITTEGC